MGSKNNNGRRKTLALLVATATLAGGLTAGTAYAGGGGGDQGGTGGSGSVAQFWQYKDDVSGTSTLRWTGVDGTTHNTWNGDTEVTAEGYYYASEDETILQPVARKDGETVDQITSTLR